MVSTLEQMQVPNGTGPGVRRSKRPLLASRTRCNVLWKPPKFGNKVKIGNKVHKVIYITHEVFITTGQIQSFCLATREVIIGIDSSGSYTVRYPAEILSYSHHLLCAHHIVQQLGQEDRTGRGPAGHNSPKQR